jgi:uncharacterized delta-60 repeat protein
VRILGDTVVALGVRELSEEDSEWIVARLDRDGALDPSFGEGGVAAFDLSSGRDVPVDVAIDEEGRLYVTGCIACIRQGPPANAFAVVRISPDGTLDATFGDGGVALAPSDEVGAAAAIALHPSGRAIVAGEIAGGQSSRFGLMAFLAEDAVASPRRSFGAVVPRGPGRIPRIPR